MKETKHDTSTLEPVPAGVEAATTLSDHDCIRLIDDALTAMTSESTDSEIAQALAHLLFTIRQQGDAGVHDALDWCIARCYVWSDDFSHQSQAFAEYGLTAKA